MLSLGKQLNTEEACSTAFNTVVQRNYTGCRWTLRL